MNDMGRPRRKDGSISNSEPMRLCSLPPWFGTAVPHIHVTPGMKHDMASIREDIGRGIALELAERERRNEKGTRDMVAEG